MKPPDWKIGLVLLIGVLAVSTAAIFSRLAFAAAGVQDVGFSLVLAASRLTLAALLLLPTWSKFQPNQLGPGALHYAIAAGSFLALHFATWITSLAYTSIAASTTLVTTNPVWVTLLTWIWFHEKPTKLTLIGTGIALTGGFLIGLGDAGGKSGGSNPLLGDLLALIGAWTASLYLLLGREAQRRGISIGTYAAIAYSMAAIILLPLPFLFHSGYTGFPPAVYLYILLTALFPQLIGHTSFNWAVRWISPVLVTLVLLFEPIGASLLGYVVFKEVPSLLVIAGAVVLLTGVAIAALGSRAAAQ